MKTIKYVDKLGMLRHFKASEKNPRNFKVGDKYVVINSSSKPKIVDSEKAAKKLNESIISGDLIRKIYE